MDDRRELFEGLEVFFQRLMGMAESEGLAFLADAEMSFTQVRTLMLLSCSEPLPIGSVAEQLTLSVHAAGRNIDRLVDVGMVERRENSEDRRVKLVSLTPQGRGLMEEHLTSRRRALQTFIDRLSADQVGAFVGVLRPILAGDYFRPSTPSTDSLDREEDQ